MLVRTRPSTFDRTFDQLSRSFFTPAHRTPVVDAAWTDGSLTLTVDLPGTPAEALDVSVADRDLTIKVATDNSSWQRTVRIGTALDADQVVATYVDGRLTVTVAPAATAQPRRIEVATPAAEAQGDRHQRQRLSGQSPPARP